MPLKTLFSVGLLLGTAMMLCQQPINKLDLVSHFGFSQNTIQTPAENSVFYTYNQGTSPKTKLVVYIHGSDPSPLFSYTTSNKDLQPNCFIPSDFQKLSDEYLYVAVEKTGFEGVYNEKNIIVPQKYIESNSLMTRVNSIDNVINHLVTENNFEKVIVYGHSEGAPIAAKLATLNHHITHLGFWAGNALPDFYDFILEQRIEFYKGTLTDSVAQQNIEKTISSFKEIAKDTASVAGGGYTNLRWWSYAEPPINLLLTLEIPIFVQVATLDQSAPIESTYLIPLEFARLQKTNLTYKVCVGCNHSFVVTKGNGERKSNWSAIFDEFILWTTKNP